MRNEQKKSDNHSRIYIIIIALVLCTVAYCSVRGCGSGAGTAEVHQRTDATMERIEKEHTVVGSELDNVTGQLISAGTAVDRADQLLQQARNELTKTQQALQTASGSLAIAEKSLRTATKYTQKLKKQIEAERKAAAEEREKAYLKGWLNGFCVGLAGGVIALATK